MSNGRKTEPISHTINPAAVAQIGLAQGNHVTDHGKVSNPSKILYPGRGIEAPKDSSVSHHCGSQGRYK